MVPLKHEPRNNTVSLLTSFVAIAFAATALWQIFQVRQRAYAMEDHVYALLTETSASRMSGEELEAELRTRIASKAEELALPPIAKGLKIDVEGNQWRVELNWTDHFQLAGFKYPFRFSIDESWTTY